MINRGKKIYGGSQFLRVFLLLFLCAFGEAYSKTPKPKFDGLFGEPRMEISNLTHLAPYYLPYNPVVIEIGSYEGRSTINLVTQYPYGTVIGFEPNPRAFNELVSRLQGYSNFRAYNLAIAEHNGQTKLYLNRGASCKDTTFEEFSSLLKYEKKPPGSCNFRPIKVPCVVLQDWCEKNGVTKIDLIQIDIEGYELQALAKSSKIVRTAKVICTKTNLSSTRRGGTKFQQLKKFLESIGFKMLSHWYLEGLQGEATFIRDEFYDSLY